MVPQREQGSVAIQTNGKIYTARYYVAEDHLAVTVPSGKTKTKARCTMPTEQAAEEVLRELIREGAAG